MEPFDVIIFFIFVFYIGGDTHQQRYRRMIGMYIGLAIFATIALIFALWVKPDKIKHGHK